MVCLFLAEPPAVKELLAVDETVINPYYMRQLLQYGIKLGEEQSSDMGPEALLREAEVRVIVAVYPGCSSNALACCTTASRGRAQVNPTIKHLNSCVPPHPFSDPSRLNHVMDCTHPHPPPPLVQFGLAGSRIYAY